MSSIKHVTRLSRSSSSLRYFHTSVRYAEQSPNAQPVKQTRSHPSNYAEKTETRTSFFRQKAEEVAAKFPQAERSTITREEQKAFDNLRRMVGRYQKQNDLLKPPPEANPLSVDPQQILALFTPTKSDKLEAEINQICQEYMTFLSDEFRKAVSLDPKRGDLAIWNVLRRRVFPLLTLLKDQKSISDAERQEAERAFPIDGMLSKAIKAHQNTSKSPPSESKSTDDSADESPTTTTASQRQNPKPTTIPPLPLITRLYPSTLLLALRLLALSHPLSPLTPSILPHIRSLGSPSYILGTNTHFYNTYLLLRWQTHSSLAELCSLLSEMERGAVEFDQGTHRLLRDIAQERYRDLLHPRDLPREIQDTDAPSEIEELSGSRGATFWLRPEQMQTWWPKLEEWRVVIARRLEEKGVGDVIREGPDSDVGTSTGFKVGSSAKIEGPSVWI